jgi:hypothetical protein
MKAPGTEPAAKIDHDEAKWGTSYFQQNGVKNFYLAEIETVARYFVRSVGQIRHLMPGRLFSKEYQK